MRKSVMAEPYGCAVTFTDDPAYFASKTGRDCAGCAGRCYYGDDGVLVGVFDGDLATLVHELTHCVLYILHRCGMNPMDSNGEAMAYLMDNLYTKVQGQVKAKA